MSDAKHTVRSAVQDTQRPSKDNAHRIVGAIENTVKPLQARILGKFGKISFRGCANCQDFAILNKSAGVTQLVE
ncbi:MAG: hypothetical protein HC849_22610 [Oscillatoriales cyanobacterium RU_3_3]|nr:hypothetical protein [Microcoleus sp. SU_5_6]NJM62353.1 hypothetical protein [Oscillatoriales cyanobacterium RU_3_3]NJR23678.1 hypothetical protein [Richelia sp. CSU_2_1]